jgi:excisionase family DNA binding protein
MFSQMGHICFAVACGADTLIASRRKHLMENTTKKTMDSDIWTVHDVAEYLRMSEAKIYRLVREQRIPVVRIGKAWRFRKDLLDDWLSQCTESSMKTAKK